MGLSLILVPVMELQSNNAGMKFQSVAVQCRAHIVRTHSQNQNGHRAPTRRS